MSALLIGRGNDAAQISIADGHKKVSRRHAELSVIDAKSCRLVDLESANGTEVLRQNQWQRISKAIVSLDHRVRFGGEFETTVRDLLQMADRSGKTQILSMAGGVSVKLPARAALPIAEDVKKNGAGVATAPCVSCGGPVSGKFCGRCGADQAPRGAFREFVGEFSGAERLSHLETLRALVQSPISATLAFAQNRAFTGHQAFFAVCTAIGVSVQIYAISTDPVIQQLPVVGDFIQRYGATAMTIAQYVAILTSFFIGFWLYTRFAPAHRSARDYLKLLCLSSGLSALAMTVPNLVTIALHILLAAGIPTLTGIFLILLRFSCVLLATSFTVYYTLKVQKEFWGITWGDVIKVVVLQSLLALMLFSLIGAIASLFFAPFSASMDGMR